MTGKDKETHDIGRWSWFLCTATVTGGAIWNTIMKGEVDIWNLTQCLIAIVTAHGLVLFAKKDTEPHPAPEVLVVDKTA
jgi:hypothetical protein